MEKIFVGHAITSKNQPFAKDDHGKWNRMMTTYSNTVNDLLLNECKGISLEKFKMEILMGEKQVSANCQEKIQHAFLHLKDYASVFANLNGINISDLNEGELAVLGGTFSPSTKINNGELAATNITPNSTGSEMWDRIINAVGIETSAILRALDLETTNVKLIVKTISEYLFENTGWIGSALTIADFGSRVSRNSKSIAIENDIWLRAV